MKSAAACSLAVLGMTARLPGTVHAFSVDFGSSACWGPHRTASALLAAAGAADGPKVRRPQSRQKPATRLEAASGSTSGRSKTGQRVKTTARPATASTSRLTDKPTPSSSRSRKPKPKRKQGRSTSSSASASSSTGTGTGRTATPNSIRRRRNASRATSGAWYQREEMLQHTILTLDEDLDMGRRIQRATDLRASLGKLAEDRRAEGLGMLQEERYVHEGGELEEEYSSSSSAWLGGDDADALLTDGGMFSSMEGMGMGMGIEMADTSSSNINGGVGALNAAGIDASDISESAGFSILEAEQATTAAESAVRGSSGSVLEREGSRFASDPIERDLRTVSDDDVEAILEVEGGRYELRRILTEGAEARNTLMRCNVRLVVSIAKKWMRNSAASYSPDGGGASLVNLYAGGWDAPSLDEVVQEGFIGLARAVDKYDPERGLRFSTYSTHWITNYVRLTFQNAKTGCLRVPYQLHDVKARYRKLMRQYYDEGTPIPDRQTLAEMLGVTENRLETALRVTESLLSIDQPISSGTFKHKGSGAGGVSSDADLLISDTLQCREPMPEDHVELSFLRQCLENAMAAELSPHERDILRLRLGLDDGQSRSVREVVAVCGGGIRPADVRSAERRAFKKLSSPNTVHAYNLRDYLYMVGFEYDPVYRQR